MYISDFYIFDLRSGQFCDLPIMSMEAISFHLGLRQNHPKQSKHAKRSVYQPFKLTGAPLTSAMSSVEVV